MKETGKFVRPLLIATSGLLGFVVLRSAVVEENFLTSLYEVLTGSINSVWSALAAPPVLASLIIAVAIYASREFLVDLVKARETEFKFGAASIKLSKEQVVTALVEEEQREQPIIEQHDTDSELQEKVLLTSRYIRGLSSDHRNLLLKLDIHGQTFEQLFDIGVQHIMETREERDSIEKMFAIGYLGAFLSLTMIFIPLKREGKNQAGKDLARLDLTKEVRDLIHELNSSKPK